MRVRSRYWILVIMLCMLPINVMANNAEEVIIEENATPEAGKKKDNELPVYFLFSMVMGGAVIYFVNKTKNHFSLYIDHIIDNGDGSFTVTWKYDKPILLMRKVSQDSLLMSINKGTAIVLDSINENDIVRGKNNIAYKMIVKSDIEIEWNDGIKRQVLDETMIAKLAKKK